MAVQNETVHLIRIDEQGPNAGQRSTGRGVAELVEWGGEPERRAFLRHAGHADPAAHHVDELFRNGQAESRAGKAASGSAVGLSKRCEQAALIALADADSGVVDE